MMLCETLESRRFMSTTMLAADVEPEQAALLVPAVQAAREAAKTTTTTTTTTTGRTGPIVDVLYSAAGNTYDMTGQLQLVVMG